MQPEHIKGEDIALPLEGLPADVLRLAALPLLEYEQVRKPEADRLEIRVSALDVAVEGARRATKINQEKSPMFREVERWREPVDPSALLESIYSAIKQFIACDEQTAITATLWAVFTWFIDCVEIAPLAVITAPDRRCGKTQLLDVLGRISRRPCIASNISPAAMYRVIEKYAPTLLIDEADAFMRDNEELRGVINSGHTKQSSFVIRTAGEDHEPMQFSTWGAKALSGIGHLSGTIMDRSVILNMRRKLPTEKIARLRHADPGLFEEIASKIARFAEDAGDAIRLARPALPDALHDRAQDNWEPLLAIADYAGGDWPAKARSAALKISGADQEVVSLGIELLSDIREVFKSERKMPTAVLLEALNCDELKPWATYYHGKPMTPRQLARRLNEYGIKSKNIKDDGVVLKGYVREDFDDVFNRYLVPTEGTHTSDRYPATAEDSCGPASSGLVAVAERNATYGSLVADEGDTCYPSATKKPPSLVDGSGIAAMKSELGGDKALKNVPLPLPRFS